MDADGGTLYVMTAVTDTTPNDASETDVISLTIPSSLRFVRLARIGVASLARRKGMSVRAIDDLRLAIDETFSLLLSDSDHVGSMDVTFEIDPHELVVLVVQRIEGGAIAVSDENIAHFNVVVADLVDRFDANSERGVVQFSKRV